MPKGFKIKWQKEQKASYLQFVLTKNKVRCKMAKLLRHLDENLEPEGFRESYPQLKFFCLFSNGWGQIAGFSKSKICWKSDLDRLI